jgi:hypothetical protein
MSALSQNVTAPRCGAGLCEAGDAIDGDPVNQWLAEFAFLDSHWWWSTDHLGYRHNPL